MKSIVSLLSIIALGLGLVGCPGSGGGSGEDGPPAFAVSTTAADFGVVGNAGYSSTLSATSGTPPYTWTDVGNVLLGLGLTLDIVTGVISGNPTASTATAFAVTFQVTDSVGGTASGPVTLRLRPRTDRASVDAAGDSITGSSNTEPSINRTNGRFIAFSSTAPNLVAGVTGNQVYVHDRQTGQPSVVSKDSFGSAGIGGVSNAASISADGRFVAFVSTAANLVPGVSGQQIYLHDTQTSVAFPNGQTTLVSKDGSGIPAGAGSNTSPRISADGRFIAFVSTAANLVPGVSGQQIYLHDTQPAPNGQITLVSKDGTGAAASSGSTNISPTISADGRFVAFVSTATNLVPGVTGQQIYLHDTQPVPNGQTTLVSKDGSGNPASSGSTNTSPTISANGRFVAFASNATNLVATVTGQQVYRHDTQTGPNGQNVVVSLNSADLPGTGGNSIAPSITDNGDFVAFSSSAPLIPPAAATDVYVRAVP